MTPEQFDVWYRSSLKIAEAGACVLLLPGEIDGARGVVTWSWTVEPGARHLAHHGLRFVRAAYVARVAMNVRRHLAQEHGMELPA